MIHYAPCKINIGLQILSRRSDGYHNLSTIMYPVFGLYDIVEVIKTEDKSVHFSSSGLPLDCESEDNLCVRAHRLLQSHYGIGGAAIHLHKSIPFGAGLGGGSSDAVSVLKLLNRIYHLNLSPQSLIKEASYLGSDTAFFVYDIPTFNERVVREAILNAVSHRNYQMGGSVFIRQYRDRLVVESPGGLPNGISLDNILDRQLPRNRRIAEILALCGLVERSGQGMNLIYELSVKEAKELPDFSGTDADFVSIMLHGLVIDTQMLSVINRIGNERLEVLSTNDFLIINHLYHDLPIPEKMRGRIKRLVELGIVEYVSRTKYVLARSLYAAAGKSGVYTRKVGLDRETNKALLVKHISKSGTNGTPFKELQQVLPGLSRAQIQTLLRELRKAKMIYCKGNTHAAKWYLVTSEE